MTKTITLNGKDLTADEIEAIAGGAPVSLDPAGLDAMARTRAMLLAAIEEQRPMYGVTTGLGPRVVERLSIEEQAAMSINTIRGRAHAVGEPLPRATVRAAMAVRANTLLIGASGADPALARLIADCLNAGISPLVRETGSIGAADLMWGGNLGLGLIGEGEMETVRGRLPAAQALAEAGLAPYRPGPREGLALATTSAFVGGIAALGLARARRAYESAQTAAALALEAFRGNLSPFDARAIAARPQPGQAESAAGLLARLEGSALTRSGQARRVQDPLSLRNVAQIHGTVCATLDFLGHAVNDEINGASDNPVVVGDGDVISSGGYLTPHLAVTLGAAAQAFVHLAAAQVSRIAKLLNPRFTDLPVGLVAAGVDSAGFAPATKTAEALFSEVLHLAQPCPVYPSAGADGVEDVVAHSAVPAKALGQIVDRLERLVAMELMIATQHTELRAPDPIAPRLATAMAQVRALVSPLSADRSLSADIETLANNVASGTFTDP